MPADGHIMSDVTVNRLTRSLALARKLSLPLVLFALTLRRTYMERDGVALAVLVFYMI